MADLSSDKTTGLGETEGGGDRDIGRLIESLESQVEAGAPFEELSPGLVALAEIDPGLAVTYALSGPRTMVYALGDVIALWADASPGELVDFIATMPAGGGKAQVVGYAVPALLDAAPDLIDGWIPSLGSELRASTRTMVTRNLLARDLGGAVHWLEKIVSLPGGKESAELVAGSLALSSGFDLAVEWATTLPVGEARHQAVVELTRKLARRDPERIGEAIGGRFSGPDLAAASEGYVRAVFAEAPEIAMEWVAEIKQKETQEALASLLSESMSRRNPDGLPEHGDPGDSR